jgi:hypothetical protein
MTTTEELLERNSSGFGLEDQEYGCRDPLCWPHGTLHPQKLALISPTSGSRSFGIVRSRTKFTELLLLWLCPRAHSLSMIYETLVSIATP